MALRPRTSAIAVASGAAVFASVCIALVIYLTISNPSFSTWFVVMLASSIVGFVSAVLATDGALRSSLGLTKRDNKETLPAASKSAMVAETVARHLPGALFIFTRKPNGDFVISWASGQVKSLCYMEPEIFQKGTLPLAELVHEDDFYRVTSALSESTADKQPPKIDLRINLHREDSVRWARLFSSTGVSTNTPAGIEVEWHCYLVDVTAEKMGDAERALMAERHKIATRAARLGLWEWYADSREMMMDIRTRDFFGIESEDSLIPQDVWEMGIHSDDLNTFKRGILEAISESTDLDFQGRLVGSPLGERVVRMYGRLIRSSSGDLERIIGVAMDVTEQVKMTDLLRQAKDAAESATRAKSEFLANVSHEIRTPMTAVLGFAEELLLEKLSADQIDSVRSIHVSAGALLSIINDILDFSKIEACRVELEQAPFHPKELATTIERILQGRAKEKGVILSVESDSAIPEIVVGDKHRLQQILINLLSNAVKFTPKDGKVGLKMRYGAKLEEAHRLIFEVSDTGMGIPNDKLGSIFEPFKQVDASITRRFGGSGLGLSIASRLAELMGGQLQVCSEVGKGSTFTCVVVVRDAKPGDIDRAERKKDRPRASRPLRILLAEDNAVNQKLGKRILEREGHSVVVANNGAEAIDLATSREFDVIFMDIEMPLVTGEQATSKIRSWEAVESRRRIPIIALTAHAMSGDKEKYLAQGMDGYLAKPLDRNALFEALNDVSSGAISGKYAVTPQP